MSTANRTPLPSLSPPSTSTTTTTTNGLSFRRVVQVTLLLLLMMQIWHLYHTFSATNNNNNNELHGARMTTAIETTNSSSLVWNYDMNRSTIRKFLNSINKKHKSTHNKTLTPFRIELSDREYKGGWHDPPFVIEKYKLIFLARPKSDVPIGICSLCA